MFCLIDIFTFDFMKKISRRTIVYTDGACKGNPGKGGWGCYISSPLVSNDTITINKHLYGYKAYTTNNEMELTAIYNALLHIPCNTNITFYMDTTYGLKGLVKESGHDVVIKNGIPQGGWIQGWIKNNWCTAGKTPVKNKELWQSIVKECVKHYEGGSMIKLCWIKGHSGIEGNEIADALANKGVDYLNLL